MPVAGATLFCAPGLRVNRGVIDPRLGDLPTSKMRLDFGVQIAADRDEATYEGLEVSRRNTQVLVDRPALELNLQR